MSAGDDETSPRLSTDQDIPKDDNLEFAKPIEDEDIFGLVPVESCPPIDESERPTEIPSRSTALAPATPATLKFQQLKERIKERALAKGIVPKPLRCDKDKDGMVEMDENETTGKPVPPARLIFQQAQGKMAKDQFGLYKGQKLKWDAYEGYLKKAICSKKRKLWDSFQCPPDMYDDDEELVNQPDTAQGENDATDEESNIVGVDDEDVASDASKDGSCDNDE